MWIRAMEDRFNAQLEEIGNSSRKVELKVKINANYIFYFINRLILKI